MLVVVEVGAFVVVVVTTGSVTARSSVPLQALPDSARAKTTIIPRPFTIRECSCRRRCGLHGRVVGEVEAVELLEACQPVLSRGCESKRALTPTAPPKLSTTVIKRVQRTAFGFRRFAHYRIRALLYGVGKPNWGLLNTITPR